MLPGRGISYNLGSNQFNIVINCCGTGKRWNSNGVFVVYEVDDLDWYLQALDIVVETCDYVLAQPDINKYVLHWSG